MSKDKALALQLLQDKVLNPSITYSEISRRSGYDKRSLMRFANELLEQSPDEILRHGNKGRKPAITASQSEIDYLCMLKARFPSVTIAQFRDIFIEDIIDNPDMQLDINKYGLFPRSISWFRQLFINQGWTSPAAKRIRVDGSHVTHPIREPAARMGSLAQIDGTPYDWFGDGRKYTLHLAVDDSTTSVLSGWFMPTECTRGYCRMMNCVINNYGIPEAIYSDKDSIFRSVKSGTSTQFADMMNDLHIRMIYANSPEAKGRVERYNGTAQLRLPNDIIRFGIKDYDQLNIWFNSFYRIYLNKKFAFSPRNNHSAFLKPGNDYDSSKIFRLRYTRQINSSMFSFEKQLYIPVDNNGIPRIISDGSTVNVFQDVFTDELYIEYYGKRYACRNVGVRDRSSTAYIAENQKDLQELLKSGRIEFPFTCSREDS